VESSAAWKRLLVARHKTLVLPARWDPSLAYFERGQSPAIPPRVDYHLTDFGEKFLTLLKAMEQLQRELTAEAER
jgi:HxlR-like helix-turn-helix protein